MNVLGILLIDATIYNAPLGWCRKYTAVLFRRSLNYSPSGPSGLLDIRPASKPYSFFQLIAQNNRTTYATRSTYVMTKWVLFNPCSVLMGFFIDLYIQCMQSINEYCV